jgi:hypothetical protein
MNVKRKGERKARSGRSNESLNDLFSIDQIDKMIAEDSEAFVRYTTNVFKSLTVIYSSTKDNRKGKPRSRLSPLFRLLPRDVHPQL